MTRIALLLLVLGLAACEVVFDPIVPSDRHFSLSGYLDVSADTQWVRIEPVARTADPTRGPLDVAVTLAGPSGDVTLTQTVETFDTGPAHLFWTTAPIEPGRTYRLTAQAPDGRTTATNIRMPDPGTFSVVVNDGPFICPTSVTVSGAELIADVQTRYLVRRDGALEPYRFTHVATGEPRADGSTSFTIYPGDDALRMNVAGLEFPEGVVSAEIVVGVGTEDWPETVGLALEDVLFFTSPLVENGLGFVGGTVTVSEPFIAGAISIGPFSSRPCTSGPGPGV